MGSPPTDAQVGAQPLTMLDTPHPPPPTPYTPTRVQGGSSFSTHGGGLGSGGVVAAYTLVDLHADLGRWPSSYYSKQVGSPA